MITKTKVLQGLIQNNATPWINAVVGPSLKPNTLLIQNTRSRGTVMLTNQPATSNAF